MVRRNWQFWTRTITTLKGLLGCLLVLVGLLVLSEWPDRLGLPQVWALRAGLVAVLFGEFLIAVVAEDLSPGAHPIAVTAAQLAPLLALLAGAVVVVAGAAS